LNDFLGILRVARDADSQAIDTAAVSRDEPFRSRRLASSQCIDEVLVAVGSDIGDGRRLKSHRLDPLVCDIALWLILVYREAVSGSSQAPWKMA